ncbi:P-loop containing nucleoside triphosphate hydrolase protein [Basidiobolus meristosporus CBS 931.73]|uniref:uridine/cytidine kinase n=1 Tax=Basidiobolus meristosporus CBS 931.73 TaxID=1314790 RepID=A0A1Y1YWJ5_9FUNG|nr:P-loop containing nucleoside triphosphate hydrolase protein [Basidiobolus meristosporus CBS 931.73]|eukprot:ORY02319.1 P-loop containing nucleoside triphosphate hydrolase protein [Basidiobolus meristosporus CBS 931.73]
MFASLDAYRSPSLRPFSPTSNSDVISLSDSHPNANKAPFIIGVAGGPGAGKSKVCKLVVERLKPHENSQIQKVVILSLFRFLREFEGEDLEAALQGNMNIEHPDAYDFDLLAELLSELRQGNPIDLPIYDFSRWRRCAETERWGDPLPDVVILEGCLVLFDSKVRHFLSMKIFADVDSDTRLINLVNKELSKKEGNIDRIITRYTHVRKPTFEHFIFPTKKSADIIMPRGFENTVAIDLITEHVNAILTAQVPAIAPHELENPYVVSDIYDKPKRIFTPIPE